MTAPVVVFWALALWAMFSRRALYVYLPWLWLPFGACAVVDPALSFHSTILPNSVASGIFVAKMAMRRENRIVMWRCATDIGAFGLFGIFAAYAAVSAYVCPKLFAGRIAIEPMRVNLYHTMEPLAPTTSNFTQAAYTVLSMLFAVAMVAYLRTGNPFKRRQTVIKALFWGGAVLAVTGLIDWLGGKAALDIFRNGSYAIVGYTDIEGVNRVTGAFSESSAFGFTTTAWASLLYFAYPSLPDGIAKRFLAPMLIGSLFFLAAASTSSTAYAGLAAAIACIAFSVCAHVTAGRFYQKVAGMGLLGAALLSVCVILLYWPDAFSAPLKVLDANVLHKGQTGSYIERSYWTRTGYQAFWASWGIGVGAGATRVSSWPAAIASNLGVIGIVSMAGQLLLLYFRKPNARDLAAGPLRSAAKACLTVVLAMEYFMGTILDPGQMMAASFGFILAVSNWRSASTSPARPPRPILSRLLLRAERGRMI